MRLSDFAFVLSQVNYTECKCFFHISVVDLALKLLI